jgi:hypothetical protein
MISDPICFACAALKRRQALSLDDLWRLSLRCVCGGVRAALNERDALEAKRERS